MKKQLKQISEFHKKFCEDNVEFPTTEISEDIKKARVFLMNEELKEVIEAIEENHDISDLAKELADLIYTILGTVRVYGLTEKFDAVFDEVHTSNMSKDFNGKGIKPFKGKDYKKADIKKVLGM